MIYVILASSLFFIILTLFIYFKFIKKKILPNEVDVLMNAFSSGGQKVAFATDQRGAGKTTTIVGLMAETYKRLNSWQFSKMYEEIAELNSAGFRNVKAPDADNLIFCSFPNAYLNKELTLQPNFYRPKNLGLPGANADVGFYPNGAIFFSSETEGDADKRNWQEFNSDSQYAYDKQLRQFYQNVVVDMHNVGELERRSRRTFNLIYSPYKYEINGQLARDWFLKNPDKSKWRKKIKKIVIHARKYDSAVGGQTLMIYGNDGSIPKEEHLAKLVKKVKFVFKNLPIPLMFDSFMFSKIKAQDKPYTIIPQINELTKYNQLDYLKMYGYGAQSQIATEAQNEFLKKLL